MYITVNNSEFDEFVFFQMFFCMCACLVETLLTNHHLIPLIKQLVVFRQDEKLDLEKEITAAEETVQVGVKNPTLTLAICYYI